MKHTFAYSTGLVTEARLLICSALAWLFSFILHIPLFIDNTVYFVINNSIIVLSLAIIIFCQIMVYREVRRHEKELSTQQVTEEARQHFLKDKKAFKLTAIIVSAGPAQQDFDWEGLNMSQLFFFSLGGGGGGGGGGASSGMLPTMEIWVSVTLRYRKVDLKLTNRV